MKRNKLQTALFCKSKAKGKTALKLIVLSLTIILPLFLTACVNKDGVEINDREYLFAVGVDLSLKNSDEYTFTAEVPVVNTGSEDKRYIMTHDSENLTTFYYDNIFTTEKIASDSMIQVIVIGEDVLKDKEKVKTLFDEIERSPQINRKVKLVVAKSKAAEIINFEIKDNPLIGRYISDFLIKLKTLSLQMTFSFDEVALNMKGYGNTLIPCIEVIEGRLAVDGAAVVKNYELVDYINHRENSVLSALTKGDISGMTMVNTELDGVPITVNLENAVVSHKISLKTGQLGAAYYVTLICNISSYDMTKLDSSDINFTNRLSNQLNEEISSYTNELIYKMQNKFQTDLLQIREYLIKYKKSDYDKIEAAYDDFFKNADISVTYKIKMNNSGMVR
jgi:Ger(x)C family germination protein